MRIGASAANSYNASSYASLWKWDSLPFGETEPNANPSNLGTMAFNHRFPGQYYDQETGLNQNWNRDYDAKIGRYVTSDPLGLRGGTNTFNYVFGSPINGHDKLGLCTIVVVNLNGLGHAGVYVDNGPDGKSMLYDPAGSFGGVNAGSGNALYGKDVNIADYIKFQERDNPRGADGYVTSNNVKVFRIDTTSPDEAKIAKNAEVRSGQNGGFCTIATSGAIKGIGPFKDIGRSFTPSGLASDLSKLAQGCK